MSNFGFVAIIVDRVDSTTEARERVAPVYLLVSITSEPEPPFCAMRKQWDERIGSNVAQSIE